MATKVQNMQQELPHRLTLDDRRQLTVTGVLEVERFDETMIELATSRGTLVVQGEGLQMLSLDGGQVRVDGRVDSLTYETNASAGGFFARLFR